MSEPDGFLERWSRRKREANSSPPPEAQSPAKTAEAEAEACLPDPDTITQEELAALPPVESIDGQTDVSVFLRKGVPAFLRNAALSRAWATDPAIRDFVNDARDYALDWNTPGGAPGYGPLTESDDVKDMVARIFGDAPEQRDSVSHDDTEGSEDPDHAATHNESELNLENSPPSVSKLNKDSHDSIRLSYETDIAPQTDTSSLVQQNTTEASGSTLANKRHGGAVPV